MKNGEIPEGSTILFKDGDTFGGTKFIIRTNNVQICFYGDITKGKPTLMVSLYDGTKTGTWVQVKPNIWKFTNNNTDLVFYYDVGTLWFFCDKGNNNCTKIIDGESRKYEFAVKKATTFNYAESNLDDTIDTILKNDLELYNA